MRGHTRRSAGLCIISAFIFFFELVFICMFSLLIPRFHFRIDFWTKICIVLRSFGRDWGRVFLERCFGLFLRLHWISSTRGKVGNRLAGRFGKSLSTYGLCSRRLRGRCGGLQAVSVSIRLLGWSLHSTAKGYRTFNVFPTLNRFHVGYDICSAV